LFFFFFFNASNRYASLKEGLFVRPSIGWSVCYACAKTAFLGCFWLPAPALKQMINQHVLRVFSPVCLTICLSIPGRACSFLYTWLHLISPFELIRCSLTFLFLVFVSCFLLSHFSFLKNIKQNKMRSQFIYIYTSIGSMYASLYPSI